MHVFVGSTNPVKLKAVERALGTIYSTALIEGFSAASKVSDQPMTDDETKLGATNRAQAAIAAGRKAHTKLKSPILG